MTTHDWQQISGDISASQYGATFGQLDENFDGTYSVNVVEILYMPAHTEYEGQHPYNVETSYCDVDRESLTRVREILRSNGWLTHKPYKSGEDETIPDEIRERLASIDYAGQDYANMFAWQGYLNRQQSERLAELQQEKELLQTWYSIPRMMRAEAMASYGGYETDSYQTKEYKTLAHAMESEGIPREALWRQSEYDEVPDDIEVGNGTRLSITVPYNRPGYRLDGIDSDGNVWTEYDMRGYLDMYDNGEATCTGCGESIASHCWHDTTGDNEQYCPSCVDYTYGHIELPA